MQQDNKITEILGEAMSMAQANQVQEAKKILKDLYIENPKHEDVCCMLGIVHIQLKDYDSAENYFNKLVSLNNNNPHSYYYLGEVLSAKKDFHKAVDYYIQSTKLMPDNPQRANVFFKIGVIFQQFGEAGKAMENYQNSLFIQINNAVAHYNLSLIYHQTGLMQKSENSLLEAIKYNPDYFSAYNNLGSLQFEQSKFKKSEQNYRHALGLQPNSNEVKINLANSLHSLSKNTEAITLYGEVLQDEPDNVKAWEALGALHRRLENKNEYVKAFKRVLELDPDNEEVKFHLLSVGEIENDGVTAAPSNFVANLFDDYADKFDSHLVETLQYKTPSYIYNAVFKGLNEPNKSLNILDLGCGTGLCGKLFSQYVDTMIGVDLSPKMLLKAEQLQCYTQLIKGEILSVIERMDDQFELVLSADVFVYIGNLEKIFDECCRLISDGGKFVFSVEKSPNNEMFELQKTGRYVHSKSYITNISESSGFKVLSFDAVNIRMQKNIPVKGYIVVLEKM